MMMTTFRTKWLDYVSQLMSGINPSVKNYTKLRNAIDEIKEVINSEANTRDENDKTM